MATPTIVSSPDTEHETQISPTTVEEPTVLIHPLVSDDATSEEDPSEDPSEEEPMEAESSEEEPMEDEPSEDLSPRSVTPTSPIATAQTSTYDPYFPGGRRILRTPRITVRSPRNNPYPIPTATASTGNNPTDIPPFRARPRTDTRRWNWIPIALAAWRAEEGIQVPTENEESSTIHISPYTQEPIHYTVPVLTARLGHHEGRLDSMETVLHETRRNWMQLAQGRVAQIYQDQEDLRDSMEYTFTQGSETSDEVAALRLRLEQCELRSQEAEQHSRMLEQRLTMAEENARLAGRLAEAVERIITLVPQANQRRG